MYRCRIPFLVLALCAAATGLSCSPGYLLRAGIEESRILSRRRPIDAITRDPTTPDETRRKLRLVTAARDFAEHVLELDAGDSYTTYSPVDSDTLLLVVSGAYRDRFVPYTWWFPIVGRVPYKGFFDFDAAYREAAALEHEGFDSYVRPSGAFSTLGWFNDPVLSTVLRYTDVGLVSTVIHEILHNTLFIPSQVAFNESLASFVGDRGAIDFFCSRDGDDTATCREARDEWADNLVFGAFLSRLVDDLESLYEREDLSSDEKVSRRERVFDGARARFRTDVLPMLRTRSFRTFADRPLNNATLIGIRLYYRGLDRFEAAFHACRDDLVATVHGIAAVTARRGGDAFVALEELIAGGGNEDVCGTGRGRGREETPPPALALYPSIRPSP
ncbi:MAG: aminopeptidase [Gemmatimonadota bacterium]|jgi:predicted aminopeptidase